MWEATVTMRIRSNPSRFALAVAIGLSLMVPTAYVQVAFGQESDGFKERYIPIATLPYQRANLSGTDSESSPTGFTVARVPAQEATRTGIAVSGAFPVDKPKVQNLRLVAKDQAGKLRSPTEQTIAAAKGSELRVITLLCEFALPERDIRELIVQRRVLVGEVDVGMVRAKVIIDEDEEEMLQSSYDQ